MWDPHTTAGLLCPMIEAERDEGFQVEVGGDSGDVDVSGRIVYGHKTVC